MTDPTSTIIEVNGVKLEVDLRTARRIDTLVIGSRVKVLIKESYSKTCKVLPGVVVAFEPFQELPTIVIAYLETDWQSAGVKFIAFNKQTENTEVIASIDGDGLSIEKTDVVNRMTRDIAKSEDELAEKRRRLDYFLSHFGSYFRESADA